MAEFDVEREADNLCREYGWDRGEVAPGLRIVLRRAIAATREEVDGEWDNLIRTACAGEGKAFGLGLIADLHERRRRREEGT